LQTWPAEEKKRACVDAARQFGQGFDPDGQVVRGDIDQRNG